VTAGAVRLGLRENLGQFSLLVGINAFVGAMVGLERSTLPLIGHEDFAVASAAAVLSFVVAFGIAKAFTNLAAGALADRLGRRRLLILGWLAALPVPLLIAVAPSWGWIVAANVLLGVNQGLAWSMTVVMKIDMVGPRQRGLALGLNESAGYAGVALAAAATGLLASEFAGLVVLVKSDGAAGAAIAGAAILGFGTALVYPTLIAAVSDAVEPVERATVVGVYRFWRDMGYVAGGLIAGLTADAVGYDGAIAVVAALTAASGLWVLVDMPSQAAHVSTTNLLIRADGR
jgi:MFS family permease